MALIQDEIASAIVDDGIRLKLSADDRSRLVQHVTGDPEAYKLYMRAAYLHAKENEADYLTARELLQQAVGKDKRFALAYTQLAWNYASMAVDGYEPPTQNFPLVEQYARQALNLNPDLLEAHNGLGASAFWYRWDWESAQREFEIDSRSPAAMHSAYTLALWAVGRAEDALRVIRTDLDRNPLNLELRLREADLLLYVRQTETAVNLYANITRDEPSDARAYFGLAQARLAQARFDEAITHLRRGYEIASGNLPLDTALAKPLESAKGAEGYRHLETVMAQIELDNVTNRAAQMSYVSPLDFARAHARLGNKDRAFEYLDAAFVDRSAGLVFLNVDHAWDGIRTDSRFEKAVNRVGVL
jgi:tetratricopeptide (TPR) repeat protein